MERAFCIKDSCEYDALEFSKLPEASIADLRHFLQCIVCKEQAYFRSKSRDGKSACFGAYHSATCEFAGDKAIRHIQMEQDELDELNKIYTDDYDIEIKLSVSKTSRDGSFNTTAANITNQNRRKKYTREEIASKNTTKSLKSILRMLVNDPRFHTSFTKIQINNFKDSAKNIFVNFTKISESHKSKRPFIFWGVITDFNKIWINTKNSIDVSIPVEDLVGSMKSEINSDTTEEFVGAVFICFGYLKQSSKGKYWVSIREPKEKYYAIIGA